MSLHDYDVSKRLAKFDDLSFAALIMAALRKADTENAAKLRSQWPDICAEMQARYDGPAGLLPSEVAAAERAIGDYEAGHEHFRGSP